ncbi:50S ribosomal protein L17 [Candidatus Uhrbacteria bacterium]|nr:50S ribosomal protein L17 [Candidatus Uhrbacteria bacterium]
MRHRKKGKVLDRPKGKREALLTGLVSNLILYEKINTTRAKAKAIRPMSERLITYGKRANLAAQRYVDARVNTPGARRKIFEVLAPRYKDRPGGYTRIIPLRRRAGDGAQIVRVEFV